MTNRIIEKKSKEILERFNLMKAPVDVKAVASMLNIEITLKDLDDSVSGFLVKKDGKNIIGLNQSHHNVRNRFTLSHEIGHFILHIDKPLFVDYYRGSMLFRSDLKPKDYKIEKEANSFAASILMPKSLITEELNALSEKLGYEEKLEHLSNKFIVSKQAMDYRLKTLGYYDYGL